ncbi:MAG: hypothetical protein AB1502_02030 [Thermodesulfobacteriota bacterium]
MPDRNFFEGAVARYVRFFILRCHTKWDRRLPSVVVTVELHPTIQCFEPLI